MWTYFLSRFLSQYNSRVAAVMAHEQLHIADMKISYDQNLAYLEPRERAYKTDTECRTAGKEAVAAVLKKHAADIENSRKLRDPP